MWRIKEPWTLIGWKELNTLSYFGYRCMVWSHDTFITHTWRSVILSESTSSLLSVLIKSLSRFPVFQRSPAIKLCLRLIVYPWHLQHKPQIRSKNGVRTTQCSFSSNRRQGKRSISTAQSVHYLTIISSWKDPWWLSHIVMSAFWYY